MKKDNNTKIESEKSQTAKKGRYAEKLNLKMDFNDAVKKALHTKIVNDRKDVK